MSNKCTKILSTSQSLAGFRRTGVEGEDDAKKVKRIKVLYFVNNKWATPISCPDLKQDSPLFNRFRDKASRHFMWGRGERLVSVTIFRRTSPRVAITGRRYVRVRAVRSSSQSWPFSNFHWLIVHSRFHNIKYYVLWTGCFCTPVRSLNTPRWVITRVLPRTDRGTFVMIFGALVTLAICTQGQLLLWSSLITTGVVPGYRWNSPGD